MGENKTRPCGTDVDAVIGAIANQSRRAQSDTLMEMMSDITGEEPVVWGGRMIGFGQYNYQYESGHKGRFFLTGFAVRKSDFSIYVMTGFNAIGPELAALGPHKHGASCLYVKSLDKIDLDVLRQILAESVAVMRERYPASTA